MSYQSTSSIFRFSLLIVLSIALMIVDHRSKLLEPVRIVTTLVNIPFESVINIPKTTKSLLKRYYPDDDLYQKYTELEKNQIILESRLQRYESLEKENQRLSRLLAASKRSTNEILLTEIIEFGLEPFNQKIIINRGMESGIFIGQPAIVPEGILGQVSEVGYKRSVITLITDASHGVPVQVLRNGLRTIIEGSGKSDLVKVPFLASQSDIQTGDILVTSGMGGRFPTGYRVAEVTDIVKDANAAFLDISATTTAKVGIAREVLLLWNSDESGENFPSRDNVELIQESLE